MDLIKELEIDNLTKVEPIVTETKNEYTIWDSIKYFILDNQMK
jgi:hypothetical protein